MLSLASISTTYHRGTPNQVRALNDVTLRIDPGEFVVVIGSNGSGKSTLLNVVAGSSPVDSGTVTIDGTDVTAYEAHRRAGPVARVFQNPFSGTAPSMTVAENMRLASLRGEPKRLRIGLHRHEREALVGRLAELDMGIEGRLDTPVGRLSGGQRQAITLLMATLRTPKILLLDEHTAALDPRSADRVMKLTADMIDRHRLTALMVTHDLDQAVRYGTRLIVMTEGRIAMDITGPEKGAVTAEELLHTFRR